MTKFVLVFAVMAIAFAACGQPDNQVAPAAPTEDAVEGALSEAPTVDQPAVTPVKLANPASTNCIDRGGELELQREPAGQFGVCVFDDGSRCEEWAFFRGECKPGECNQPTGKCD